MGTLNLFSVYVYYVGEKKNVSMHCGSQKFLLVRFLKKSLRLYSDMSNTIINFFVKTKYF